MNVEPDNRRLVCLPAWLAPTGAFERLGRDAWRALWVAGLHANTADGRFYLSERTWRRYLGHSRSVERGRAELIAEGILIVERPGSGRAATAYRLSFAPAESDRSARTGAGAVAPAESDRSARKAGAVAPAESGRSARRGAAPTENEERNDPPYPPTGEGEGEGDRAWAHQILTAYPPTTSERGEADLLAVEEAIRGERRAAEGITPEEILAAARGCAELVQRSGDKALWPRHWASERGYLAHVLRDRRLRAARPAAPTASAEPGEIEAQRARERTALEALSADALAALHAQTLESLPADQRQLLRRADPIRNPFLRSAMYAQLSATPIGAPA